MKTYFQYQFETSLDKLKTELEQIPDEILWQPAHGISNSCGTLILHLIGNVNHFLGAQLGKTGYVRNRDKEFADRNVPREQMLEAIVEAKAVVSKTFYELPEGALQAVYPLTTFGEGKATAEVLLLLVGHFNYHLGQINYLRRFLS